MRSYLIVIYESLNIPKKHIKLVLLHARGEHNRIGISRLENFAVEPAPKGIFAYFIRFEIRAEARFYATDISQKKTPRSAFFS